MWYRGTPRLHAFQLRDQILGARVLNFRFVHKFFVVDMFAHRRIEIFPLDLCSHRELRADLCDDRSLLLSLPSFFNLLICCNSPLTYSWSAVSMAHPRHTAEWMHRRAPRMRAR